MPVYELSEEQDRELLPENIYDAEVVSIKEQEKTSQKGKQYKKLLWTFAIEAEGESFNGQYAFGDTFPDFNTRSDCELRAWAQEVMATEFPPGYQLDTDVLVGMHCRIDVRQRTYEKNGDERTTNYVKDVLRSRSAMTFEEEPF